MSAFNWPVSNTRSLQPSKYLPPDLRKLILALGGEIRVAFAGATYLITPAPLEGETGLRADYLHYHLDRVVALLRTLPSSERPAVLANQCRLLGETDLTHDEVGLICHLVEAHLPRLEPAPMDDGDGHVVADLLEVRGAVLRGRVRDFFRCAITAGVLQPWRVPQ
ncbi:hypothetical protein [Cupriavidus basilensis]